ncbi:nitrate/nitrite two-component system sensor histidine kinase NarQ [Vibrio maerlii]|uniref:nitrate/nitrite two-component system sensor histidine kinase NarQ n=1 Tax=Vibrio maerlii TaxID=2231648 RepID=UPI000E3DE6D2|nr:nitrate/nitrite two-component system sensor histidine kinase NarQ [Vibrio maerlii]
MKQKTSSSVIQTVAKALGLILLLAITTFSFAVITLSSSLSDAEAVNVSGSMRMQSYRLAHDINSNDADFSLHIEQFEESLYTPALTTLQRWSVPDDIIEDYQGIIKRWGELKKVLQSDDNSQYLLMVADFVSQIDEFVFKLQQYSEKKTIILSWVGGLGLGGILLCAIYVVHFVRRQIIKPLNSLVLASEQIQNHSFDVDLNVESHNEMGVLTNTFNQMAKDLGQLYRGLESAVNEKTAKLQQANKSLEVLYKSSQELSATRMNVENFQNILNQIASLEGIVAVKLEVNEEDDYPLVLAAGDQCLGNCTSECNTKPLQLDGVVLGNFHWKAGLPCPDPALIDNFIQILSRAVYYNQAQRQTEQLILMEERATIARELHDSLAQSLSYLKIQVSLLKRLIAKEPDENNRKKSDAIVKDIEEGLVGAYTQLRELLTTFRLTIKEGSFGSALTEMLKQLNERTQARIVLNNELSSVDLDAHQQVHMLQLIREATINAIKHSDATKIEITCLTKDHDIEVTIRDDGEGFKSETSKLNHYGMSIMQERAARLNGQLLIDSEVGKGCTIKLSFTNIKEY